MATQLFHCLQLQLLASKSTEYLHSLFSLSKNGTSAVVAEQRAMSISKPLVFRFNSLITEGIDDNVAHEFCRGYSYTHMKLLNVFYPYLIKQIHQIKIL
jgi:hypothetical protein